MVAQRGRSFVLKKESEATPGTFVAIAGGRVHSLRIGNDTIDITNKDDAGVRQLLGGLAGLNVTIQASGVFMDEAIINTVQDAVLAGDIDKYQIILPGSVAHGTFEGKFQVTEFEFSGETNGAIEYSFTLVSAGGGSGAGNIAFT